jgi:hypothetical protein
MDNQRRNRGQWNSNQDAAPRKPEPRRDAGAYLGRKPAGATETIPGGVGRKDQRVSAVATQPSPVRGSTDPDTGPAPEGHREAGSVTDDQKREAGERR